VRSRLCDSPRIPLLEGITLVIERDDLMWLAGLLEGEGYFGHKGKSARLSIECTDRDVAGRAAMLMRGKLRARLPRHERANPTYVCEVGGEKAVTVMQQLLPHMGARRSSRIMEILFAAGVPLESTALHCPPGLVAA
jgi:hypothetical protein